MNLVSELDLPSFDYTAPDFSADRYHQQLAETRQLGWLAKSPLAYMVLDHDSGEFFLRSRVPRFPGRQIAEFFGVTGGPLADLVLDGPPQLGGVEGIYGIDKLPIIWSVSPKVNPNHGPVPYVS
jgi:hypothetical protein